MNMTTTQKTDEKERQAPLPVYTEAEELDLLELLGILWRARFFIAGFTLISTLGAVFFSLFMLPPPLFQSETVIRSLKNSSGGVSKISGIMNSLPIPLNLGSDSEQSDILTFLNSRNIKIRLIEKYNLLAHMNPDLWDKENQTWRSKDPQMIPTTIMAIQKGGLNASYKVSRDKMTGLISIAWIDEDPVFAYDMVKRVMAELTYYLENEFETAAKKEREFIDNQLQHITRELEHWERQVPSKTLPLARIQRERLASQSVYTELRKQLELAKIHEARELISFKVIDEPFIPEKGIQRSKRVICILTMMMSGFFSIFLTFGWNFFQNLNKKQKHP